jgi:hypothetical protein
MEGALSQVKGFVGLEGGPGEGGANGNDFNFEAMCVARGRAAACDLAAVATGGRRHDSDVHTRALDVAAIELLLLCGAVAVTRS